MSMSYRYSLLFGVIIFLSGCVIANNGLDNAQIKPIEVIKPDSNYAVINFYHPVGLEDVPVPLNISLGSAYTFIKTSNTYQIWDKNNFIGFLPVANRCFQYKVSPGDHVFLGRFVRSNAGNWTVLKAKLQAGREYYIGVSQRWNTWKPAVVFEVLKPADPKFGEINSCRAPFTYNHDTPESEQAWNQHVNKNMSIVSDVMDALQKGSQEFYFDPSIQSDDGR